ncbi:MAG: 4Fe-4S dicluster domain-containing protein [Deltaproteobacteria bacterium]|nr:4Fe-4S dicluster domain-containing protein [Deltaproteobacteria bacterium]MBN2688950.1 4Fe-4S dicluster domain-containing protein [Deltaproteobacteria bacterium]
MSNSAGLKAKLGLDVFKPGLEPHIVIRPGMEKDPRLKKAILVCPAGLYSENEKGEVVLTIDGCLECGTCRIACGTDVLDWNYPDGGTGVQFRFG